MTPLCSRTNEEMIMTYSIKIDFLSYEVMKIFVGSFDEIAAYFDSQQDDEGNELRNSSDTWGESRFSVEGSQVCDATALEMFQYFYNGSTGGFDWEKDDDGNTSLIRKGILNPRGQY